MRCTPTALRGVLFSALVLALLVAPWDDGLVRSAHAEDEVELNIGEEDVQIEFFLRSLSQMTGTSLIWNPSDKNIRGKKMIGGVSIKASRADFFALARSLLTFYELVMIPVGPPNEKVYLVMDARQTSSILRLKPEHVKLNAQNLEHYETLDGYFITTTIQVEHMTDLRNARNALTRIVTGQNIGNVTEVPSAKAFVVTDFAPNVCAIYRLLKEMDVPSASSSTTSGLTVSVKLEFASAMEVAGMLSSHFAPKQSRPPQAQVSGPSAPRITADTRTNTLLLTGTGAQIDTVKHAITLLDVPVSQPSFRTHFRRMKNVDASRAANALIQLISSSPSQWGRGESMAGRPSVVHHDETDAVIVSGTEEDVERLLRLLDHMDMGKTPPEKK